jgi:hypothetical protein
LISACGECFELILAGEFGATRRSPALLRLGLAFLCVLLYFSLRSKTQWFLLLLMPY